MRKESVMLRKRIKGTKRTAGELICIMVFTILIIGAASVSAAEIDKSRVFLNAEAVPGPSVELNWSFQSGWKQVEVDRWDIHVADQLPNGQLVNDSVIESVSGDVFSYTDLSVKEKEQYTYYVHGMKNIDGVDTLVVGCQAVDVQTSVSSIYSGESSYPWDVTPGSVLLSFETSNGYKPNGFEVYRSDGSDEGYVLHDTKEWPTEWEAYYNDETDIVCGTTYYYVVRPFINYNGKRIYGKYANIGRRIPANPQGIFTVKRISKFSGTRKSITVRITSDKNNGELRDRYYSSAAVVYFTPVTKSKVTKSVNLRIKQYSKDGKHWKAYTPGYTLKAGETIYLKLGKKNNASFKLPSNYTVHMECSYKDVYDSFIDCKKGAKQLITEPNYEDYD